MTRDAFTTEFLRGMRFVLQKHEREVLARRESKAPLAIAAANTNTDAAIQQLADHVFDGLESIAGETSDATGTGGAR